jgi:hypothetical protein
MRSGIVCMVACTLAIHHADTATIWFGTDAHPIGSALLP